MLGSVVDLVLIVLIILFAVNGYRQGFLIGALSFVGFFGCALVGLQLAPWVVGSVTGPFARVAVSLALIFGLALLGQTIAAWAGGRLRRAIHSAPAQRADDVGGVLVSVLALLLVSWMVAAPLAASSLPSLSREVRNSAILHAVDALMPTQARGLYNRLQDAIAGSDFPAVFGDLTPTRAREVAPPDPALLALPAVTQAQPAVVKVTGTAPSCRRRIEGTGFVFAPQHVMTNAHVVAGTEGSLSVESTRGTRAGRVVYFNPDLDIAVLYVPNLDVAALTWAPSPAESGADALVLGYPLDGPFTPTSARVRDIINVRGPNIYEDRTVTREVYVLRATVRSGNSGGPLLDTNGRLLGVIFAAAMDDPETGFALTRAEVGPVAESTADLRTAVATGTCT